MYVDLVLCLKFFKKFRVGGGGVDSEFSVLLWSNALVLDLDHKKFTVGGRGVPSEFSVLLWSKALVLDLDQTMAIRYTSY